MQDRPHIIQYSARVNKSTDIMAFGDVGTADSVGRHIVQVNSKSFPSIYARDSITDSSLVDLTATQNQHLPSYQKSVSNIAVQTTSKCNNTGSDNISPLCEFEQLQMRTQHTFSTTENKHYNRGEHKSKMCGYPPATPHAQVDCQEPSDLFSDHPSYTDYSCSSRCFTPKFTDTEIKPYAPGEPHNMAQCTSLGTLTPISLHSLISRGHVSSVPPDFAITGQHAREKAHIDFGFHNQRACTSLQSVTSILSFNTYESTLKEKNIESDLATDCLFDGDYKRISPLMRLIMFPQKFHFPQQLSCRKLFISNQSTIPLFIRLWTNNPEILQVHPKHHTLHPGGIVASIVICHSSKQIDPGDGILITSLPFSPDIDISSVVWARTKSIEEELIECTVGGELTQASFRPCANPLNFSCHREVYFMDYLCKQKSYVCAVKLTNNAALPVVIKTQPNNVLKLKSCCQKRFLQPNETTDLLVVIIKGLPVDTEDSVLITTSFVDFRVSLSDGSNLEFQPFRCMKKQRIVSHLPIKLSSPPLIFNKPHVLMNLDASLQCVHAFNISTFPVALYCYTHNMQDYAVTADRNLIAPGSSAQICIAKASDTTDIENLVYVSSVAIDCPIPMATISETDIKLFLNDNQHTFNQNISCKNEIICSSPVKLLQIPFFTSHKNGIIFHHCSSEQSSRRCFSICNTSSYSLAIQVKFNRIQVYDVKPNLLVIERGETVFVCVKLQKKEITQTGDSIIINSLALKHSVSLEHASNIFNNESIADIYYWSSSIPCISTRNNLSAEVIQQHSCPLYISKDTVIFSVNSLEQNFAVVNVSSLPVAFTCKIDNDIFTINFEQHILRIGESVLLKIQLQKGNQIRANMGMLISSFSLCCGNHACQLLSSERSMTTLLHTLLENADELCFEQVVFFNQDDHDTYIDQLADLNYPDNKIMPLKPHDVSLTLQLSDPDSLLIQESGSVAKSHSWLGEYQKHGPVPDRQEEKGSFAGVSSVMMALHKKLGIELPTVPDGHILAVGIKFEVLRNTIVEYIGIKEDMSEWGPVTLYDVDTKQALRTVEFSSESPGVVNESYRYQQITPYALPVGSHGVLLTRLATVDDIDSLAQKSIEAEEKGLLDIKLLFELETKNFELISPVSLMYVSDDFRGSRKGSVESNVGYVSSLLQDEAIIINNQESDKKNISSKKRKKHRKKLENSRGSIDASVPVTAHIENVHLSDYNVKDDAVILPEVNMGHFFSSADGNNYESPVDLNNNHDNDIEVSAMHYQITSNDDIMDADIESAANENNKNNGGNTNNIYSIFQSNKAHSSDSQKNADNTEGSKEGINGKSNDSKQKIDKQQNNKQIENSNQKSKSKIKDKSKSKNRSKSNKVKSKAKNEGKSKGNSSSKSKDKSNSKSKGKSNSKSKGKSNSKSKGKSSSKTKGKSNSKIKGKSNKRSKDKTKVNSKSPDINNQGETSSKNKARKGTENKENSAQLENRGRNKDIISKPKLQNKLEEVDHSANRHSTEQQRTENTNATNEVVDPLGARTNLINASDHTVNNQTTPQKTSQNDAPEIYVQRPSINRDNENYVKAKPSRSDHLLSPDTAKSKSRKKSKKQTQGNTNISHNSKTKPKSSKSSSKEKNISKKR